MNHSYLVSRRAATALALVAALAADAAADGHPPTLAITTDWGVLVTRAEDNADGLPGFGGLGGLIATVRKTGKRYVGYADGMALFLGGIYGVRVGVVLGKGMTSNYGEITSVTQSTQSVVGGTVTTTTMTGQSYDHKIHNVMGLNVSASLISFDGTGGTVLAAGFGWMGQNVFELQGLYDGANGVGGFRINFMYALGDKSFSIPARINFDAYFGEDAPVPFFLTFGIGGGSGFQW